MPEPGNIIIDDITKWRDKLKIRDVIGLDWEEYYKVIILLRRSGNGYLA